MSSGVSLEGATPPGYAPAPGAIAAPNLAENPNVALEQWEAACSKEGCASGSQVVSACFRASASTWSPEVDELVQGKLADMASNAANRARGEGALEVVKRAPGERTLEGDGLAARTMVAFTSGGEVHACFALCVGPRGGEAPCKASIEVARVVGPTVSPPETSASLGAILAMVHHPTGTFVALVALVCTMGLLAIVLRPGRRRRPGKRRYSVK